MTWTKFFALHDIFLITFQKTEAIVSRRVGDNNQFNKIYFF